MAPDYPVNDPLAKCVALLNGSLANYNCTDVFNSGTDIDDANVTEALAYICEARPLHDVDLSEMCYFPFKYNDVLYSSCSHDPVDEIDTEGRPWCATEVDNRGNAITSSLTVCQDERHLIEEGSGVGSYCPLPFLHDRIYFDHCTRKGNNDSRLVMEYFWCPDPTSLPPGSNEYTPDGPYGICNEHLQSPGTSLNSYNSKSL